jgi:ATP-dependent Lhr-like helicase
LARVAGSRVLYRAGVPVATSVGGQVESLVAMSPGELHAATRALALDPAWRWLEAQQAETTA